MADRADAENWFMLAEAMARGAAVMGADDPRESARGAYLNAMAAGDPEWSPRAAVALGTMLSAQAAAATGSDKAASLLDGARRAYREAAASGHREHRPVALFNLGAMAHDDGDHAEAVRLYREAAQGEHPEIRAKALVNTGYECMVHLGDLDGAAEAFRAAAATGHAEQAELARQNLAALSRLRDQGGSVAPVEEPTDLTAPESGQTRKHALWAVDQPGSPAPGSTSSTSATSSSRQSPPVVVDPDAGLAAWDRGDTDEAERLFRQVDAAGVAVGSFRLGLLLSLRGDRAGAIAAYERAVERGLVAAMSNLGMLYELEGRLDDARRCHRDGAARGDQSSRTRLRMLAELCEGPARRIPRRVSGTDADASPEVGRQLLPMAQAEVDVYRQRVEAGDLRLRTRLANALGALGALRSETGHGDHGVPQLVEAADVMRRVVADAKPDDRFVPRGELAGVLSTLAIHLAEAGRLEEAVEVSREAAATHAEMAEADLSHLPFAADAAGRLGALLGQLGRFEEADAALSDAIDRYARLARINPRAYGPFEAQARLDMARGLVGLIDRHGPAGGRSPSGNEPWWKRLRRRRGS